MSVQNIVQKGVGGAAVIGRIDSVIGVSVAVVISFFLFLFGGIMLSNAGKHSVQEDAKITKVEGFSEGLSSSLTRCDLTVSYANGHEKTFQNIYYDSSFINGKTVSVYYNKNDPSDVILAKNMPSRGIAYLLIIIGLFILIGSIVNVILVFRFRAYAAARGATDVIRMVR